MFRLTSHSPARLPTARPKPADLDEAEQARTSAGLKKGLSD
jgi:hypothetical protein